MHKLKLLFYTLAFVAIVPLLISQEKTPQQKAHGNWPPSGYVPDAITAVKIRKPC